jgi:predicted transcriptional regulator
MTKQLLIQQVKNILGVTNGGLERLTGLSKSAIGRWIAGTHTPDNGSIFQLMYFFELKTGDRRATENLFNPFIKDVGMSEQSRIKAKELMEKIINE